MRLLTTDNLEVKLFANDEVPSYAILSHTWEEEEVTLQDMEGIHAANKKGYGKVKSCCSIARANGFEYVWIDTCCIDKTSSAELSEAINSMYHWYQDAEICYAYLADVPLRSKFSDSRWFTRGWTLQELIAPSIIIFLDGEWKELGTKETLRQDISDCTGIPVGILSEDDDLEECCVAQRMSWAARRQTTRIEDRAYSLLGIFGINMPLIYGERETAFIRLQEEIMRTSDDQSLFAWKSPDNRGGIMATSPDAFINSGSIVRSNPFDTSSSPLTLSSRGVHLELRFMGIGPRGLGLAILHCKERDGGDKPIAIYVKDIFLTMDQFERVESEKFNALDLRKYRPSQYPTRKICIRRGHLYRMRKLKDLEKCGGIEIYPDDTLSYLMNFENREALIWTAKEGLEDKFWLLLTRHDIEVNLKTIDGLTALSQAVRGGHEVIIKMLLARSDIEVDIEDVSGRTSLSWAARLGLDAIVKLLLNSGKVKDESKDRFNRTPLMGAVEKGREAVVQLLLNRGVKAESEDMDGQTPLMYAAIEGNEAIVRLLLQKGAIVESKDTKYKTPLMYAADEGREAIVRLLLQKGAIVESQDAKYKTPLMYAAEKGREAIARLLLQNGAIVESKDRDYMTPLLYAAQKGHEAVVRLLLENGADTESRNVSGKTPLTDASERGHVDMVRLLLDKGASVDSKGWDNQTPLILAVQYGYENIVRLLLENGASVSLKDLHDKTPLMYAAHNGYENIVQLLLDKGAGADAKLKDGYGKTALKYATQAGHKTVVKLLKSERKATSHF